jgi:hypothetical protein
MITMIIVAGLLLLSAHFAFAASNSVDNQQQTITPEIVSTPVTEAFVGQEYTYTVEAQGSPTPTFELLAAPTGMTINASSGTIKWVPDLVGSFEVQVLATNSAGTSKQSYRVRVAKAVDLASCPVDMVAYWQLEEINGSNIFTDIYGGHHASCTGLSCTELASGQVGNGQYFDGNETLTLPDASAFNWGNLDSFSVEAWVNTTQLCINNAVFVGKYRSANTYASWWLGCSSSGEAYFSLRDSDGNIHTLAGKRPINDGNWHHIAAVRNATERRNYLYVNGQLESSVPTTYTGGFASTNLISFGSYINTYHYVGILDDIAIYKRALTASDVEQHYLNGLSGIGYCSESTAETPPQITSTPITKTIAEQTYNYHVKAIGFPSPSFQLLTKPDDMTIDSATGLIQWEPDTVGNYEVIVRATNSAGSIDQSFTITVTEPLRAPIITSTPVTLSSVKGAYRYKVIATGHPTPAFQLVDEPPGMTIDADTGLISWIPETPGNYSVKVEAKNSVGVIGQDFVLQVRSSLWLPKVTRD